MSIYYLLCAFTALFDNILEHPEAPDAFADLTRLNLVNRLTPPSFLTGTQGGLTTVLRIAQELAHMASVASSVYAVNTAVFSPNNTYGSTTSNQKYVLYHTAVQ